MTWYLLNTKPRNEQRAYENIQSQGYEAFYPTYQNSRLVKGRRTEKIEALFPGYLFVNTDNEHANFNALRSTRGIYDFVRFGGKIAEVSKQLIQQLKNNLAQLQHSAAENSSHKLKRGDAVMITEGSFKGLQAIFEVEDGLERSVIFISLLAKQTKLTLSNAEFVKQSA